MLALMLEIWQSFASVDLARPVHALARPQRLGFFEVPTQEGSVALSPPSSNTVSSRVSAVGPAPITMGGSKEGAHATGQAITAGTPSSPTFVEHLFFFATPLHVFLSLRHAGSSLPVRFRGVSYKAFAYACRSRNAKTRLRHVSRRNSR